MSRRSQKKEQKSYEPPRQEGKKETEVDSSQEIASLSGREIPKCPRCDTRDNIAVSTQGRTQYRKCRRAVCRYSFKVIRDL